MEVVSELLGHSKMATTQQSYGKIVQKKVGDEIKGSIKTLKVAYSPMHLITSHFFIKNIL